MSNLENDRYLESLYEIIAELEPHLKLGELTTIQQLINQNDLEGAKILVESLEATHADDLRG